MEALGRREATEAAPRFECPGDFSAVPFAPGPPFSPEMLQDPTKQLLLIRAPADFSPESLNNHLVPLSGLQTLKVLQPDRTYKLYGIQTTPGGSSSCARLLVPSDHRGQIGCAPPFAGSLSVWERFGDPSTNQILLPIANRLAPQIPDGLKQRFLPFGGQLKRPLPASPTRDAEMPPKKKKKKRQLYTMGYLGDPEEQQSLVGRDLEVSFGGSTAPLEGGGTSRQQEEEQQEKRTVAEGGEVFGLSGAVEELPEQETQASSSWVASSQDSIFLGEAEELSHRINKKKKKKKKKLKEEVVENKEPLPDPNSVNQQSEDEPQRQGQMEPQAEGNGDPGVEGLVQHKHKKKKKHREEAALAQADLSSPKEEAERDLWEGSGLGNVVDSSLDLTEDGPGGEVPGHKSKKKKKKEEKVGEEEEQPLGQEAGQVLLEFIAVKQEQTGWDELDTASGEGVGRTDSLELSLEVPIQKHKKKKKKKEQESEAP